MLTVDNPVPTITEVSPRAVEAGVLSTTLIVTGTDFITGTVLRWNGADRPTTVISSTRLLAAIGAADLAAVGTASITAVNPAPGGGTSNALTIIIEQPAPIPDKQTVFLPLVAR
jgi:hypothetical protein